ncbi:MAG: ROK family protein [Spirochaeta sp.]
MNLNRALGIDIGGTTVKTGYVTPDGQLENQTNFPTPQGPDAGEQLLQQLKVLCTEAEATAIGIGTPGLVDQNGRLLSTAENITGWGPLDLQDILQRITSVPVRVLNDVSAATYGEYRIGAGQGSDPMIMLALGTGLGGGIVINGDLVFGHNGLAGEFGMMVVEPHGRVATGLPGSLESYASATGIVTSAKELAPDFDTPLAKLILGGSAGSAGSGQSITARMIYEYRADGDKLAVAVHEKTCDMLARGLGGIIAAIAPQAVILGGGVMRSGTAILSGLEQRLGDYTYGPMLAQTMFRAASSDHAGIIGGALYASDKKTAS